MVKRIPTTLETHGHGRIDDYYWLRERDNPEVIKYLNDENAFAAKEMAHAQDFERKLFEEIKARIKQTDMSVPYKRDDYFYYTRYEEGKEYPIYARKRGVLDAAEEIMLDVNLLAVGHDFFSVGGTAVSAGQNLLAYAVDTQGRRIHTTYLKNLTTGELLADVIPNVSENLAWANDNRTLFYGKQDETTLRQYQIWRHRPGPRSTDLPGRRPDLRRLYFQNQVEEVFDDRGVPDGLPGISLSGCQCARWRIQNLSAAPTGT
jgi:oligopeptidase B